MPVSVLNIGLCPSLADAEPEAKYVLRTLSRIAGYASAFAWADGSQMPAGSEAWDIYYGPATNDVRARIRIDAHGSVRRVWGAEPRSFHEQEGLGFIEFERTRGGFSRTAGTLHFHNDIVRSSYWLLTGAREPNYAKDVHGGASLDGTFLQRHALLSRPLVSDYATFLRGVLQRLGIVSQPLPWTEGKSAVFVFTHDVDYPQMIRWIECLRLTKERGVRAVPSIRAVLAGSSTFWKFAEWIAFARAFEARPAFYFSARQGSLWQYARGTPDCFYDIAAPEFRELFQALRESGCEIGLHTSYHSYKSGSQIAAERRALQRVSGDEVVGNRHHYFRVKPQAPHETLALHEEAGFSYDSSLAFAYYPGYRRGVCHPFHAFHPGERREISVLQLPVAWMDDHFHRRLTLNHITDPEAAARGLMQSAQRTGGVAIVDYHVRGMNADFFPQYGPWLQRFAERHLDSTWRYLTPNEVARQYREYEQEIDSVSRDTLGDTPSLGRVSATEQPAPSPVPGSSEDVSVGPLQPHDEGAWDAFVESHPAASIYHTIAWKRITEEGLGHRSLYLRATNLDGEIVGILPLFQVSAIGGKVLVSVPLRDKGGPLVHEEAVARQLLAAAVDLTRSEKSKSVAIKFPQEGFERAFSDQGFSEEKHWVTTVVPVAMGEEKLWNDVFRSPTRRAINKARNSGLVARWSTSEADLERFYRVFLMTRRKLGVPAYPLSFFRAIWKHLAPQGRVRLLLVEREGATQGALLVFPFKREVVSAYMGSDPDAKDARVNDLLFWEAIRWSAAEGFDAYYFGADSPYQEGLLHYKRKWGGEQFVISNYFYATNGVAHRSEDSSSPAYARTRRVMSLLPVPIFRALGSVLTRKLW